MFLYFFETYYFPIFQKRYFVELLETDRKYANSKNALSKDLAFFVEGHCTRSVNLHYSARSAFSAVSPEITPPQFLCAGPDFEIHTEVR